MTDFSLHKFLKMASLVQPNFIYSLVQIKTSSYCARFQCYSLNTGCHIPKQAEIEISTFWSFLSRISLLPTGFDRHFLVISCDI